MTRQEVLGNGDKRRLRSEGEPMQIRGSLTQSLPELEKLPAPKESKDTPKVRGQK
ncbi:MAG: hypothetical protein NTU61_04775 [Candidatus Altiarchaeota archaeon]|nr:hypothetical protein [Candidatus Altiarchaeota archaeon]